MERAEAMERLFDTLKEERLKRQGETGAGTVPETSETDRSNEGGKESDE
jgi:hypothetical protein